MSWIFCDKRARISLQLMTSALCKKSARTQHNASHCQGSHPIQIKPAYARVFGFYSETQGFEPWIQVTPYNTLAGCRLQPARPRFHFSICDLSAFLYYHKFFLFSINRTEFRSLEIPFARNWTRHCAFGSVWLAFLANRVSLIIICSLVRNFAILSNVF